MNKTKKEMKSLILSNVMVLALAVVMLTTMSFAWFFSADNLDVIHEMHIGKFSVKLTDSLLEDNSVQTISVTNIYPATAEKAQENEKMIYGFEVENNGEIPAQIRISAHVERDSGYGNPVAAVKPLSGQFRFATKIYTDPLNVPVPWTVTDGFLFGDKDGNVSLKQHFNGILLDKNADGMYTANSLGVLYPVQNTAENRNKTLYIKILIWLDENATIESTGASTSHDSAYPDPEFKFKIKVEALQRGGGAGWTWDEHLKDMPEEAIPA